MDTVPQEIPTASSENPDAAVREAVGGLRPGWVVLRDCVLLGPLDGGARRAPVRVAYALLHPNVGVALLDVEPAWTPDASARLRRRLDAAKFSTMFPGHLPVVYRSLPAGDLHRLRDVFDEAFGTGGAIDLPGGPAWMGPVQRALALPETPEPPEAARRSTPGSSERRGARGRSASSAPFPPSARRTPGSGRRAYYWSWTLAVLALGGGAVAILHHVGFPDGFVQAGAENRLAGAGLEVGTPTMVAAGADGAAGVHARFASPPHAAPDAAFPTAGAERPPEVSSVPMAPDPGPEIPAPSARPLPPTPFDKTLAGIPAPPGTANAGPVDQPAPAPDESERAPSAGAAVAQATGQGTPDAGQVGGLTATDNPSTGPEPASSDAPDTTTPDPARARDRGEVQPAPAADADRLFAEIAALQHQLQILEGGPAEGGAAVGEEKTGNVREAHIAPEVPARVPPAATDGHMGAGTAVPGSPVPAFATPTAVADVPEASPRASVSGAADAAPVRADTADAPAPPQFTGSRAAPPGTEQPASLAAPLEPPLAPPSVPTAVPETAHPSPTKTAAAPPDTRPPATPFTRAEPPHAPVRPAETAPPSTAAAAAAAGAARPEAAVKPQRPPPGAPPAAASASAAAAAAALLARGDALVALGDVAAARLVYQRAAAHASARAATAVGRTYDPRFLRAIGAIGVVADPDAAAAWYRKGSALGDEAATPLLGGLEVKASR